MNLREEITNNVTEILGQISDPQPILVTREPFEADKLAITQFPALLVSFIEETRNTETMGPLHIRSGEILYQVRGFVRGGELDKSRNALIYAIEQQLSLDRYLDLKASGVLDSQVIRIEVIQRLAPLAEFLLTFRVNYKYESR